MTLSVFQGSLIALGLGAASGSVAAGLIEGLLGPKYLNFYTRGVKSKAKEGGAFAIAGGVGFVVAMGIGVPLAYYGLSSGGIGAFGYIAQFFFGLSIASLGTATMGWAMVKAFKLK